MMEEGMGNQNHWGWGTLFEDEDCNKDAILDRYYTEMVGKAGDTDKQGQSDRLHQVPPSIDFITLSSSCKHIPRVLGGQWCGGGTTATKPEWSQSKSQLIKIIFADYHHLSFLLVKDLVMYFAR